MVSGEIDPRERHKCDEAGDKVLRAEQDMGSAVLEQVLELVDDLTGGVG